MDKKSISLISKIHRKIISHSFDENDIFILLVLVREEAATNRDYSKIEWEYGFLREICDFVAHRYRNKGFAFEEARYIYQRCTTTGVFHFDTESKRNIVSGMFEDVIIEALNPLFSRVKRSRCRSSQEINDAPTPFSALNYCLPICAKASFSLSKPNIAAYETRNPRTTAATTIYHTTAIALIWQ